METCTELQNDGGWWEDQLVNRCKFPIGPRNTFSNLAYVAAGILVLLKSMALANIEFAAALVFLGVCSGTYHGFKTPATGKLDDAGMYAVFSSLLFYVLSPHYPLIGLFMLIASILTVMELGFHSRSSYLHPFVGLTTVLCVVYVALNDNPLIAGISLLIFGGAYIIWWMDKKKTFTVAPKWGHAFWHLFTATAIYTLFMGVK